MTSEAQPAAPASPTPATSPPAYPLIVLGALTLAATVYVVGSFRLDAPWLDGDERIRIADHPAVSRLDQPLSARLPLLLNPDVPGAAQPLAQLSYVFDWARWGDARITVIRRSDVLLHAGCALLVWWLASRLLRGVSPAAPLVAFAVAFLWAQHPLLSMVYAADVGRPAMLSTLLLLIASGILIARPGAAGERPGALIAAHLSAAMGMLMSPSPGWYLIVLAAEASRAGWRGALTSVSPWLALALSAAGAWWALRSASGDAGLLGLWWGGLTRFAVDFALPGPWLAPRDPLAVGSGAAAVVLTLLGAGGLLALLLRGGPAHRVGAAWVAAGLLQALLIAASGVEPAARDFYASGVGVALLAAGWLGQLASGAAALTRGVAVAGVATLLVAAAIPLNMTLVEDARSTLARAQRSLQRDPQDPRRHELLARANFYALTHPTPEAQLDPPPDWLADGREALHRASQLAPPGAASAWFPRAADQAAFRRRLSYLYWLVEEHAAALGEAQEAARLAPHEPASWLRLAQAQNSVGEPQAALEAYRELAAVLPRGAPDEALRMTEYGTLALEQLQFAEALEAFTRAVQAAPVGNPEWAAAKCGLARSEVLVGRGARGRLLAEEVLAVAPGHLEATLVVALYHLRSHHFVEAEAMYAAILDERPDLPEALRSYQEVCGQLGIWEDAAARWEIALRRAPQDRLLQSFFVWSLACADHPAAGRIADQVLELDHENPFACLSHMLLAIRAEDSGEALYWLAEARRGEPAPGARELERAEAVVRLLRGRDELPCSAAVAHAALLEALGQPAAARETLLEYLSGATPDADDEAVQALLGQVCAVSDESASGERE